MPHATPRELGNYNLQNYNAVFTLLWAVNLQEGKQNADEDELLAKLEPEEFTLGRKRWLRRADHRPL
ncbi:MAG: hypothetical protein WAM39_13945 [Bryobacteraceae bacterium]